MTHEERAAAVLETAIRVSVKGLDAAAASMIRGRVESCLSTALARCKEDAGQMHQMIDVERQLQKGGNDSE